jgi:hypothetical protein
MLRTLVKIKYLNNNKIILIKYIRNRFIPIDWPNTIQRFDINFAGFILENGILWKSKFKYYNHKNVNILQFNYIFMLAKIIETNNKSLKINL